MKVSRLKKTVAAVALLLVFTAGGFALGLAHDNALAGSTYSLDSRLALVNRGWQLENDNYPLRLRFQSEIGNVSSLIQRPAVGTRRVRTVPAVRRLSLISSRVYTSKIPLHLLDLILLI